jgi:hypothetical protein
MQSDPKQIQPCVAQPPGENAWLDLVPVSHRPAMTDWYAPLQLLQTGLDVLVSLLFSNRNDLRWQESFTAIPSDGEPCDQVDEHGRQVLDFIADTGDGWLGTLTMAWVLSAESLQVEAPKGEAKQAKSYSLRRGDVLVFGGDQVYPTPAQSQYEIRFFAPFEAAANRRALDRGPRTKTPRTRRAYALPGNHDWYDGLLCFREIFLARQKLGDWELPQGRSYFALRLAHGWWFIGLDLELHSDVDHRQREYFDGIIDRIVELNKNSPQTVILCTPEPFWVFEAEDPHQRRSRRNVDRLRERLASEVDTRIYVAGDLHHYRRHSEAESGEKRPTKSVVTPESTRTGNGTLVRARQYITAGGGGAFLHPTHAYHKLPANARGQNVARLRAAYPDHKTSAARACRNFAFAYDHPRFAKLCGAVYLLLTWTWATPSAIGHTRPDIRAFFHALRDSPFVLFTGLSVAAAFLLFTDTSSKAYRWLAGTAHGVSHLLLSTAIAVTVFVLCPVPEFSAGDYNIANSLILALCLGSTALASNRTFFALIAAVALTGYGLTLTSLAPASACGAALVSTSILFLASSIAGATLFGIYLWTSVSIFGRHRNESYSSLAIPDFKHFLRFVIEKDSITMYPIAVIGNVAPSPNAQSECTIEPTVDPEASLASCSALKQGDAWHDSEVVTRLIEPPVTFRRASL